MSKFHHAYGANVQSIYILYYLRIKHNDPSIHASLGLWHKTEYPTIKMPEWLNLKWLCHVPPMVSSHREWIIWRVGGTCSAACQQEMHTVQVCPSIILSLRQPVLLLSFSCTLLKKSLGNPYLDIIDPPALFVAYTPVKNI